MPKKKRKKGGGRWILKWMGISIFIFVLLSVFQVLLLRFIAPPFTMMTGWERVRDIGDVTGEHSRIDWRPLREISPHIRRAVLAAEDQRFLSHNGFDFVEISEAVKDMASGRGHRGASTITMQTARTVYLWPGRNLLRKILEAYYTVLIEILWSKQRILEVYLNTVDWGKGIMGIEAASKNYFHVSSAHISRRQAALLAAILPSPHRWSPNDPNPQVLKRHRRILRDMPKMPLISAGN